MGTVLGPGGLSPKIRRVHPKRMSLREFSEETLSCLALLKPPFWPPPGVAAWAAGLTAGPTQSESASRIEVSAVRCGFLLFISVPYVRPAYFM